MFTAIQAFSANPLKCVTNYLISIIGLVLSGTLMRNPFSAPANPSYALL